MNEIHHLTADGRINNSAVFFVYFNIKIMNYPTIFFKIMVPLSIPSLCTIALFIAVGTWNEWYSPMLYLQDSDWWPMALRIRNIIIQGQVPPQAAYVPTERMLGDTVKMATVVLSVIPILAVYPSIQKYFVKGMMIGAVKS